MAIVTGGKLPDWLKRAGITFEGDHARRVILDIEVGKPVKVFVERFGDERMFQVDAPNLKDAEVRLTSGGDQSLSLCGRCGRMVDSTTWDDLAMRYVCQSCVTKIGPGVIPPPPKERDADECDPTLYPECLMDD